MISLAGGKSISFGGKIYKGKKLLCDASYTAFKGIKNSAISTCILSKNSAMFLLMLYNYYDYDSVTIKSIYSWNDTVH